MADGSGADGGADSKGDLQQNMEKIRQLVQSKSAGDNGAERQMPEPPGQQQQAAGDGRQQQEPAQQQGGQQRSGRNSNQGQRQQERSQSQGSEDGQDREEASLGEQEMPEAPETRELNVPEMDKGPLFIRVAKFKEAKQLVSDMQRLNEELETQLGGLQNTLEEDRQTNRELNDTLKKLQDSMKTIRNIVSP